MKLLEYIILFFLTTAWASAATLTRADSLFDLRNETFNPGTLIADSANVNQSIALYQNILESETENDIRHQALWKVLQAYYFKGQFTSKERSIRKRIYDRGIQIGQAYLEQFPNSVEVHSWMGILWARWAEEYGIWAAAKKGVAAKIKTHAEKTIELDDAYLDAGGYRLLGMLHFSVPKIPLLLTWPSRDEALSLLQKANRMAPKNLYNKLYLAQVLYAEDQNEKAESLLKDILNANDIVHDIAVDSYLKHEAGHLLDEHS